MKVYPSAHRAVIEEYRGRATASMFRGSLWLIAGLHLCCLALGLLFQPVWARELEVAVSLLLRALAFPAVFAGILAFDRCARAFRRTIACNDEADRLQAQYAEE